MIKEKKVELLPGWNINSPIPEIVLGVSIDTYYNFKKNFSGGFTWSFEINRDELYDVEKEVMDFLARMTEKNFLGRVQLRLQTQKIGQLIQTTPTIEYVNRTEKGWLIGDTY